MLVNEEMIMLWGHSRGTPPNHKGKQTFAPYSGFTPGTLILPTPTRPSAEVLPPVKCWKLINKYNLEREAYKKAFWTKYIENVDFEQHLEWAAPKPWLKYTTEPKYTFTKKPSLTEIEVKQESFLFFLLVHRNPVK